MGLTEDRDPAFWASVLEHPDVAPHATLGSVVDLPALLGHPAVTPLRAVHGGFIFYQMDGLGLVQDLHSLFTPDGWGREALLAAKSAAREMFRRGTQLIVTHEVYGWKRSQPPRSFGFVRSGDFTPTPFGDLRLWTLSREAWEHSPANRT